MNLTNSMNSMNSLAKLLQAASFAALNAHLLADCRRRLGDRLRGQSETIGERLARDLACFHDRPASPYEACETRPGRVSSLSLVRYRGTDYSVPTAYGHREVLIRGYVESVVIACGAEIIARHVRSYEREDFVYDPLHYLALLERKVFLGLFVKVIENWTEDPKRVRELAMETNS